MSDSRFLAVSWLAEYRWGMKEYSSTAVMIAAYGQRVSWCMAIYGVSLN